ncbi:acyl-Coenzyme A dehydrogenase [Capsaspora owczarzaki ATCC 30864]|uniref:Very long-chain specific acyl-CoA dehydrogenase, mitochondrial n=1 Tax=Capsaspora owczarzaki (strain ATCC 30864) TaxID=595528 RepID=A0A0D2WJR3_CAPO3|nr:acyl-Coenzyme A dehydrogenase [Capsaspora owczarzaki ATCC 30864]KJE89633.1 acyl-Coenzyme A dehydrogenase [Capsaspora owczarzaki ATCC 30864]|eukprot:XP_004365940.2 acyl-Coenzyme A dehydrogenase [Capsaspora owczarzaki ATCC 30864]
MLRAAMTGAARSLARNAASVQPARTFTIAAVASAGSSSSAAAAHDDEEGGSFARGLFSGRIRESQVFPFPAATILNEEAKSTLQMLVDPCAKFFETVNDPAKNDETASISKEAWDGLKEMGAFGLQVPEELGGLGLTNTGYARLVEIVGMHDLGVGIALGAHQSIGFKGITLFGTKEQKAKYLPKLAAGENIAAFALTEPSSGSDANSIRSRAKLSADGKHWVLNGSKIWISNGGIAEIFTVFAQTQVPDRKTGELKDKVTAFIVERSFGGLTNGKPENKMGIKCSNTAEVYFDDVKIPVENVLGQVGEGFKVAMAILNNGRFGMGAALSGTMKAMLAKSAEHAINRTQFGSKIKEFGMIKEKFAQMALKIYATESMAYTLAANMDRGSNDYQIEAAISKVFASEAAWSVADEALQVMGGIGFMKAAGFERVVRDLRIFRIFEGANEILRMFIALTGIQDAGKDLKEVQAALKSPISNFGVLSQEATKRIKRIVGVGHDTIKGVHPLLRGPAGLVESQATAFGAAVDSLLITHGRKIIDQQLKLKRVADAAIDLYASVAVLSRATHALNSGAATADQEVLLATTFCEDAHRRIRRNIASLNGKTTDGSYARIADSIFEKGSYDISHPIGF